MTVLLFLYRARRHARRAPWQHRADATEAPAAHGDRPPPSSPAPVSAATLQRVLQRQPQRGGPGARRICARPASRRPPAWRGVARAWGRARLGCWATGLLGCRATRPPACAPPHRGCCRRRSRRIRHRPAQRVLERRATRANMGRPPRPGRRRPGRRGPPWPAWPAWPAALRALWPPRVGGPTAPSTLRRRPRPRCTAPYRLIDPWMAAAAAAALAAGCWLLAAGRWRRHGDMADAPPWPGPTWPGLRPCLRPRAVPRAAHRSAAQRGAAQGRAARCDAAARTAPLQPVVWRMPAVVLRLLIRSQCRPVHRAGLALRGPRPAAPDVGARSRETRPTTAVSLVPSPSPVAVAVAVPVLPRGHRPGSPRRPKARSRLCSRGLSVFPSAPFCVPDRRRVTVSGPCVSTTQAATSASPGRDETSLCPPRAARSQDGPSSANAVRHRSVGPLPLSAPFLVAGRRRDARARGFERSRRRSRLSPPPPPRPARSCATAARSPGLKSRATVLQFPSPALPCLALPCPALPCPALPCPVLPRP